MTSSSSLAVTSPDNRRIANRQARNRKRWRGPKWKAAVAAWIPGKKCECDPPCGRDAEVPHHPLGKLYETDELYLDFTNCIPMSGHCHRNLHRGYVRCTKCNGWMQPGRDSCSRCNGNWREGNVKYRRVRHSCQHNIGTQLCARKHSDGLLHRSICPHSSRKAEADCEHYKRRERK